MKRTIIAFAATASLSASMASAQDMQSAYVAGGCFWCVEADFEKLAGVEEVISGYMGGDVPDPTYNQVVAGGTGHYEAVEIIYNAEEVSYAQLMNAFFRSVDPLDAGGQFCDRGESYRTAIFVENEQQRQTAEAAKAEAESVLGQDVVTPILDAVPFYVAEAYHQDYYLKDEIILTRRGPKTKADAYDFYRDACQRDERVRELWGQEALFAG